MLKLQMSLIQEMIQKKHQMGMNGEGQTSKVEKEEGMPTRMGKIHGIQT